MELGYHIDRETLEDAFGTKDYAYNLGVLRQLRLACSSDPESSMAVIRVMRSRNCVSFEIS
jgi:hypothetical protein